MFVTHLVLHLSTKVVSRMPPLRIRRPDDFHVHLRDGNSMVYGNGNGVELKFTSSNGNDLQTVLSNAEHHA